MKEKSVAFYKRLIIFTTLLIIIVIALFAAFFVGKELGFWEIDKDTNFEEDIPTIGNSVQTTVSSVSIKIADEKEKHTEDVVKQKETVTSGAAEVTSGGVKTETKNREKTTITNSEKSDKTVYLTFDDGSSKNTERILEVLKENEVEATFFLNTSENQTSDSIIKKVHDDGHGVGVLTSTDSNYDAIYSSKDAYLKDLEKSFERICRITGEEPEILRFPGGSINGFNKNNYKALTEAVIEKGFVYFDWNICADNGSRNMSKEEMVKNGTNLPKNPNKCIVLMHDNGNENTCEALEEMIRFYKENGYEFARLSTSVKPITF